MDFLEKDLTSIFFSDIKDKDIIRLAWLDLIIGFIPTPIFIIILHYILNCIFVPYSSCGLEAIGVIVFSIIYVPFIIINFVFSLLSFEYLSKRDIKGIKSSLKVKIFFLILFLLFMWLFPIFVLSLWTLSMNIIILFSVVIFFLFKYTLAVKNYMEENYLE